MKPPEGYLRLKLEGAEVWAWHGAEAWAADALRSAATLHAWAAGRDGGRALEGRGTVHDVPAPLPGPEGRARWAVRHFHRGGMIAPLLDDRYLNSPEGPRPFRELCCSVSVRERGIRSPAVVAGAVYPAGLFYRADLVTELVPDGVDLRHLLFSGRPKDVATAAAALGAAGRLVRRMELRGVYHPDLNAANILLTRHQAVEAHLLDLDRCQARTGGAPAPRGPMEERLERSLRKLGAASGRPLTSELWDALRSGFQEDA